MRKHHWPITARSLALSALAIVAVAGCGSSGRSSPHGTYVGSVNGSSAYIALVAEHGKLSGYVCDGRRLSTWFEAVGVSGDRAVLRSRHGRPLGTATLSAHTASGSVTIDGAGHPFTTRLAGGSTGLYVAARGRAGNPGSLQIGWIVLVDGSQRGAETDFISNNVELNRPAPTLHPGAATVAVPDAGSLLVHGFINQGIGL